MARCMVQVWHGFAQMLYVTRDHSSSHHVQATLETRLRYIHTIYVFSRRLSRSACSSSPRVAFPSADQLDDDVGALRDGAVLQGILDSQDGTCILTAVLTAAAAALNLLDIGYL